MTMLAGCSNADVQGGSGSAAPAPSAPETSAATAGSGISPRATDADGNRTVSISGDTNYNITRNGVHVTVLCTGGGDVNVDSTNARVTMTGDCRALAIDGDVNMVTAEKVSDIRIDGDTNTVDAGQVNKVEITGTRNTAELGTANEIRLEGRDNNVSYPGGGPSPEDQGTNNTVSPR